jgi:hypothetical protein
MKLVLRGSFGSLKMPDLIGQQVRCFRLGAGWWVCGSCSKQLLEACTSAAYESACIAWTLTSDNAYTSSLLSVHHCSSTIMPVLANTAAAC